MGKKPSGMGEYAVFPTVRPYPIVRGFKIDYGDGESDAYSVHCTENCTGDSDEGQKPSERGATSYERLNFADRVAIGNIIADDGEDKIQAIWDYAYKRMQLVDGEGASEKLELTSTELEPTSTESDTREKLEADVRKYANPSGFAGTLGASCECKMLEFIDRQAAITEREYGQRFAYEIADEWMDKKDDEVRELKAKVDRLTAERCNMNAELANWEDDVLHLRELVKTQASSITKLEAENARLRKNEDSSEKLVQLAEENAKLRERAERAEWKIADQREEIANVTFRKNVDRMAPKKLKDFQWPRFASGRKVRPGKDCREITFTENGYAMWSAVALEGFSAQYGEHTPDLWNDRERSEWQ